METAWHIIIIGNIFYLGFLTGYLGPAIFRTLHKGLKVTKYDTEQYADTHGN